VREERKAIGAEDVSQEQLRIQAGRVDAGGFEAGDGSFQ
jgi:hypothetical protein